jgi:PIN domain nuclease of toxin-antitoxin system
MIIAVADTHALIWALLGDPRLSLAARASMTVEGTESIGVSAISLVEIV